MMRCCDPTETCFRKTKTYGQCKSVCPTNTEWDCYTASPTASPTTSPTGAPTTQCAADNEKCVVGDLDAGGSMMRCCDPTETCFRKTENYGQCKSACPNNAEWDCYTASPTSSPTTSPTPVPTTSCSAGNEDCVEGDLDAGGSMMRCCDSSQTCFRKDQYYGQCKSACPTNENWDCFTNSPTSSPTPSPTPSPTATPTMSPTAANINTLKDAGALHGLPIGCVINYAFLDDPTKVGQTTDTLTDYTALAGREYNWLTEENGCKWRYSEQWDRLRCVEMLEFAEENGMAFRGHALVWGKAASNPDYFDEECVYDDDGNMPGRCKTEVGDWTVEQKYSIMDAHVKNESEYYAGRLAAWDVVNEAVCDCWFSYSSCEDFVADHPDRCGKSDRYSGEYDVYLKKNIYWPDMPDYISRAFEQTKKYDPKASLGYNEYKFEALTGWQKEKSDMTYQLIKSLKDEGVPVDYVGSQTHIDLGYIRYESGGGVTDKDEFSSDIAYLESVKRNVDRYARIGVEWHFTELTIAMNDPSAGESNADSAVWSDAKEEEQAQLYKGLMDICLDNVRCTSFQTWGFVDGWTKAYAGLKPYPFDTEYDGKKSFDDLMTSMKRTKPTARWTEGWCAAADEKCSTNDDCCSSVEKCHKMTEYESYCRFECPTGWECANDDSGEEETCIEPFARCEDGDTCCGSDNSLQCFRKSEYYSQCRPDCPSQDPPWACEITSGTSFSGDPGTLAMVGGGLSVIALGLAFVCKRLYTDCTHATKDDHNDLLDFVHTTDLDMEKFKSEAADDLFFRHHNAFDPDDHSSEGAEGAEGGEIVLQPEPLGENADSRL
mmetsp:Transcript_15347/g.31617  ORF Transcript_15347/g.31617 Transcript_15347/m.31617 type:complete len:828 (-) Transcript_15347:29-2512(-)